MKILAVDTATEACSVALLYNDEIDGHFEICPQQHSQRLLPMIDELLKKYGITVNQLDAIAYGRGPGSFTGVRIATGVTQGLALGADLPIAPVSTLQAMAQQEYMQNGSQEIQVLIDARMQEVYTGHFRIENELATAIQAEDVLPPQQAFAKLAEISHDGNKRGYAGTGWQAYKDILLPERSPTVLYPNAKFILPIARALSDKGSLVSVDDMQPTYLRDNVTWKKLPGKA